MRSTENRVGPLPTGRWLAKQREIFSQTVSQMAKALNRHTSTIHSLERNDRVIPPGWRDPLRALGMQMPSPVWPGNMPPYFGRDLERDMNTRAGLQHSRFWLSKKLCVPEEAVATVIRGNLMVPHDWLLKLAELGASVPAVVQMALHQSDAEQLNAASAPDPLGFSDLLSKLEQEERDRRAGATGPEVQVPHSNNSSPYESPGDDSEIQLPAEVPPEKRNPESFSLQWSQQEGLHFSLSTSLLEQLAAALKELIVMYQSGLIKATQSPTSQRSGEPSRG